MAYPSMRTRAANAASAEDGGEKPKCAARRRVPSTASKKAPIALLIPGAEGPAVMRTASKIRFRFLLAAVLLAALFAPANAEQPESQLQTVVHAQAQAARPSTRKTIGVLAIVDADGKVTAARAVSGDRRLRPAALGVVRAWKFGPGSRPSRVRINIEYMLDH